MAKQYLLIYTLDIDHAQFWSKKWPLGAAHPHTGPEHPPTPHPGFQFSAANLVLAGFPLANALG